MRIFILVLSIISLLICGVYKKNFYIHRDTIKWHERNQLQVSDFVEVLRPYESDFHLAAMHSDTVKLESISNHAAIYSTVKIEEHSKEDITDISVEAVFDPNQSYFINQADTLNRRLLTHEEYHFHTTEAIARKIRHEIMHSINTLTKEAIQDIYNRNRKLKNSLTEAYDNFTQHGALEIKQIHYQSKIDSMLAQYSAYSDPHIRNYNKNISEQQRQITGNNLYKTPGGKIDSLSLSARKDKEYTINLYKSKFIPYLGIDNLDLKNGQVQRIKASFINNGLFNPAELGKSVTYSIKFKHNAYNKKPFEYITMATIYDTAYISFVVDEDLKSVELKKKFISVQYKFNLNGKDTTFVCEYDFNVIK